MSTRPISPEALLSEPAYHQLKDLIIGITGLAYYVDRDDELAQRIASRLTELAVPNCADYMTLMEQGGSNGAELDKLTEQLTIGETYFFRHQESFDALRDIVLPDLIQRNQAQRSLRIWSAGCSTGAEAYSLAILLKRDLAPMTEDWEISILGTDINREYLASARLGQFESWAMRSTPIEVKQACFFRSGPLWCINPEFQRLVRFQHHNLVKDLFRPLWAGPRAFDLILCRNVMIYVSPDIAGRIVEQCHECLADKGWLLVGHAESNPQWYGSFRAINADGATLYQKAEPGEAAILGLSAAAAEQPLSASGDVTSCKTASVRANRRPDMPAKPNRPTIPMPQSAAPPRIVEIRTLADGGQLEAAGRTCQQLLETDHLNPAVHFYHGLIFKQLDLHQQAEAALKRAIYLKRDYVVAHYHLAVIRQQRGDLKRARQSFINLLGLLSPLDQCKCVPDADGLTVAEMEDLVNVHLKEVPV